MKRILTTLSAATVLLAGCKDYSYETWTPDTSLHTAGDVSLMVTFENLQTKVFMDDRGHGTWERGDQIAVACSDGSFEIFNLDGTGDTKRAVFSGSLPAGKQLGGVVVYPPSAAKSISGDNLTLTLSEVQQASVSSAYPGVLVGKVGSDWQVDLKQVLGFINVRFDNFPVEASSILLDAGAALSGTFTANVDDLLAAGLKPSDAQTVQGLSLAVKNASKSIYAMVPVPVADYSTIQAIFLDNKGKEVISQPLSDYSVGISRAELHDMTVTCAEAPAPPCRINLGGERITMDAVAEGIFEGEFEVPATTSFTIELDGAPFGFATSSGAGGLGTISADNSALPVTKVRASKSKRTYYVKRAQGTMASTDLADNPFTVDLESPGKMHVLVDATDPGAPKYKINVVQTPDASVIFHEDFDLCVFGGDYLAPADGKGCKADSYDGYMPATGTVTQNNGSFPFDYPNDVTSAAEAKPEYMQAYGLQDWEFAYAAERPGGMQLCAGAIAGYMLTPAFATVQGSTDAVIEIEMARFSTSSTDPVYIKLQGGGSFSSGTITRDAYTAASQAGASYPEVTGELSAYEDGGATAVLADNDFFPHSINNADIDKPVTHVRLEASGITSATKLMIDCPKGAKNAPRIFVFDIKVTRK
ncbi:MAG: hypothetical protein IJU68_08210 [Bacteroidales bacterium]|nr:hypothetical protein [Bacteroidales bacterium]